MFAALKTCRNVLRKFRRDEEGSLAVETIIIVPALFWTYLAMFATFDAYYQHSTNQKIAYTIGDIISRETNGVDNEYMNGMRDLLKYLASENSNDDVSLRVTVLYWDEDDNRHRRDWSKEKGFRSSLSNDDVRDLGDRLPVMTNNERLVVVETAVKYEPPFQTGLRDRTIENFVFTRPRYAPQILYLD